MNLFLPQSILARLIPAAIAGSFLLASCASSGGHDHAGPVATPPDAVDLGLLDETPIRADKATLYVEGLSCPACATNVDHQLKDVQGVKWVEVDLGDGTVDLTLGGSVRPSRATLARAIHDSGFTLRRIEVGP